MTTTSDAPTPRTGSRLRHRLAEIGRPPRIMGLDVARGLAIIGMAAAHLADPTVLSWRSPSTWGGVVHGRSSILFALLAGVSTALITGRTRRPDRAELPRLRLRLLGRGAAIFVIGLALELLNSAIAVILCVYGVLFVCAIPFLRWRPRSLVIGAAVLAVAGPFVLATLRTLTFSPPGPGVTLAIFGMYPVPVWLAFLLTGLAIGRIEFTTVRAAASLTIIGIGLAIVGYAVGAVTTAVFDSVGGPIGAGSAASSVPGPAADGGTDGVTVGGAGGPAMPGAGGKVQGGIASQVTTVPGSQLATLDATGMTCDTVPGQWINCYPPQPDQTQAAPTPAPDSYWSRLAAADPVRTTLKAATSVADHSGGAPEIVGSGGFALAVLGVSLLAARPLRFLLLPIACLGMMPLTTYSVHVTAYWLLAGGPGGYLQTPSLPLWLINIAALILAATVWTVLWGRGPLERLVGRWARRAEGQA